MLSAGHDCVLAADVVQEYRRGRRVVAFYIGRLKGVGAVRQMTAVDVATWVAVVKLFVGDKTATVAAGFLDHVAKGVRQARHHPVWDADRHSIWVGDNPRLLVDGWQGSGSSGTCPSTLLDRVERNATPCLLTALAGEAHCRTPNPLGETDPTWPTRSRSDFHRLPDALDRRCPIGHRLLLDAGLANYLGNRPACVDHQLDSRVLVLRSDSDSCFP